MDAQVATHEHAHPKPGAVPQGRAHPVRADRARGRSRSRWPTGPPRRSTTWSSRCSNEILIILSAAKFALVAMFYMHLKQDSRIFSGLFVFPLIIAAVMIGALLLLFAYLRMLHPAA